jgi:hypothetical protein
MSALVHMRRAPAATQRPAIAAIVLVVTAALASSASAAAPPVRAGSHLVGTYDGSTLRLYVDGREVAQRTVDRRIDPSGTPLEIGTFYAGPRWSGVLDEIAIYRRALPPATVRRHYRIGSGAVAGGYAGAVRRTPGLVAYWHLSERAHRTAVDSLGRHSGHYPPDSVVEVPGLIARDPTNRAIAFKPGRGGISVPNTPELSLTGGFSLEAWAAAAVRHAQPIVVKVGSWFLQTDAAGHWGVGFFSQRRDVSVYTRQRAPVFRGLPAAALRAPAATPAPATRTSTRSSSDSGGSGGKLFLVLGFLVVIALAGLLVIRGRRRVPGPEEPVGAADAEASANGASDEGVKAGTTGP